MKQRNKNKQGKQGKTPTQPKRVVELTEQDLEQVQGGWGGASPQFNTGNYTVKIPPGPSQLNDDWTQ